MSCSAWLGLVQGIYYLLTGVWPLFSMRSFEKITGPKRDKWLVRTVGVLIVVIGCVLLSSAWAVAFPWPAALLGSLTAAGLILVDMIAWWTRTVSRIYLADAVVELAILTGWGLCWT